MAVVRGHGLFCTLQEDHHSPGFNPLYARSAPSEMTIGMSQTLPRVSQGKKRAPP